MSLSNILERPGPKQAASMPAEFGQRFIITVDTEEEFDWNGPMRRTGNGVSAIGGIVRFQSFCEERGLIPLYLIDHPVATSEQAAAILGPAVREERAELGLHLHPWTSPPFVEELSERNSFAGNLPREQERDKFNALLDTIVANFGVRPVIYRAGRYGAGPHTAEILRESGFLIDSSVRSNFDYSIGMDGPDFSRHPLHPYWLDEDKSLLELPVTTIFWGLLRDAGPHLYRLARQVPRLAGLLSRLGLLERIALTPEGITVEEAIRAIDVALDDRLPVLVFSFHSPSLTPGHTPYVRNEADLERFYDWWRAVLDYLAKRGTSPVTVGGIVRSLSLA